MIGEQSQVQRLDKQWRGRTVFKIKSGVELPEELSTAKSSSKLPRISDPSEEVKSAYSPTREKADDPKSSSAPAEEGKPSGSGSTGPKRRLSQKTTAVAKDE